MISSDFTRRSAASRDGLRSVWWRPVGWLVLLGVWGVALGAEPAKSEGGWSADLLSQILKADGPKPGVITTPIPSGEVVLHTYHLTNLRVAEAGKAQNILALLGRLLPPGSSVNPDVPANSLHVLTTPAAHQAVWDYLSAVDLPEPVAAKTESVPEEVKAALLKLAHAGDQSTKLINAVSGLKTEVAREISSIDARQRQQTIKLAVGGVAFGLIILVTLAWMIRRRPPSAAMPGEIAPALALAPDQLATALVPVHDRMRNDMLGLLNEVAIKLQAQHNEQQKLVEQQRTQLEDARHALADERKQFISEAGTMVIQAVERVDASTAKLARQQDKVAELVQELQSTVRELDHTKDSLRDREIELEQERSKIAALSILLEEGASVPTSAFTNGPTPESRATDLSPHDGEPRPIPSLSTPCTTHDPITFRTTPPDPEPRPNPEPRFTFLPPDPPAT